ncbi:hypothetical protein TWF694_003493 [Orbilia ellipsospora]|uniref:Polyketide synthase n=1 Tax=Orbilia ellipsospora TaxID=2528407 RepID=A0AAV9WYC5_9PEZI
MSHATPKTMPIAIVGMACRFPGGCNTLEKFWEICEDARNTWSNWPEHRLNERAFHHPRTETLGAVHTKGGHFLEEDVTSCDTSFFNFTADLAKAMDPQIRILLEMTFEALESAGLSLEAVAGSPTSVFAGTMFHDYEDMLMQDVENLPRSYLMGTGQSMVANRISHFFDLRGPSVSVDTACSTAMTALHLACQSIRSGDAKMAVVGGTNLLLYPSSGIGLSTLGLSGAEGKSFGFDSRAGGYGRGEGVAAIILKPLDAALQDGDPIRAVIRETGMNQDGRTPTITSPSREAQEDLIRAVYRNAGLDPVDTTYVESHGTGTIAGDTTETSALGNTIGLGRPLNDPLLVGSVKANFGHTEATSGLAAVIKAVLMLEKGYIPPQALFSTPNPAIDFASLNIKVSTELIPWPENKLRRISINNFGAGGTNTHAIVEAATYHLPVPDKVLSIAGTSNVDSSSSSNEDFLVTLCSREEKTLRVGVQELVQYLKGPGSKERLSDLAYTLTQKRTHFPWRISVTASSVIELQDTLANPSIRPVQAILARIPRLGFVFTGQGAQWFAMGRELIPAYPIFRETLEKADQHIKSLGSSWSVFEELHRDKDSSRVNEPYLSFPLSVILQLALVKLLAAWGIVPTACTGHSSGEIPAAYAAGHLTFEDAITIAFIRGQITSSYIESGRLGGAMTAMNLSKEAAKEYIRDTKLGVAVVACVNSPTNVTLSGDVTALGEIEAKAESAGIFYRRLKVPAAYHSPHMETLSAEYTGQLEKYFTKLKPHDGIRIFASPVTGKLISKGGELRTSSHWVQNMVQCVQFSDALRAMVTEDEPEKTKTKTTNFAVDVIIEIGPHGALQSSIRQILSHPDLKTNKITIDNCLKRGENAVRTLQSLAGRLFCQGYPVSFSAANFPNENDLKKVTTNLPAYQWNHSVRYWSVPAHCMDSLHRKHPRNDLLGVKMEGLNNGQYIWRNILRVTDVPWLRDHTFQSQILFPGAGWAAMAAEAMHQISSEKSEALGYVLTDVDLYSALVVPETDDGVEVQLVIRDQNEKILERQTRREFHFYSRGRDGKWIGHCKGMISSSREAPVSSIEIPNESNLRDLNVTKFYTDMESNGPTFGPSFQNISQLSCGPNIAVATVKVADTISQMPFPYESNFWIHPTTLDACFQTAWATMSDEILAPLGLCLPKSVDSVYLGSATHLHPGSTLKAVASLVDVDKQGFEVSLAVYEAVGSELKLLMKTDNLRVKSLAPREAFEDVDDTRILDTVWRPDISFLSAQGLRDYISQDPLSTKTYRTGKDLNTALIRLTQYMELYAHKYPQAKILELGAGLGTASVAIFDGLAIGGSTNLSVKSYDYTDTSSDFFPDAQQKFQRFSNQIQYRELNIENEPSGQGFSSQSYDLIIAYNYLHTTTNIQQSIQNVRELLKPAGKLLIVETENPSYMGYGYSQGFPTLSPSSWEELLLEHDNFSSVVPLTRQSEISETQIRHFMIASTTNNIEETQFTLNTDVVVLPLTSGDAFSQLWLQGLKDGLQSLTSKSVSIGQIEHISLMSKTCIILENSEAFLSCMSPDTFNKLKAVVLEADRIIWISQDIKNDPASAMHVGFLRTLRMEDPDKQFISLRIQHDWNDDAILAISTIFRHFPANVSQSSGEFEYFSKGGQLRIPRLTSNLRAGRELQKMEGRQLAELKSFSFSGSYIRLEAAIPELLDSLVFRECEPDFEHNHLDGMVDIQPHAFGLNFRDVFSTMGKMKEKWMGFECAGYISRIGSNVPSHLKVGDRVCALMQAGHWANKVRTRWTGVLPVPETMSMETAASIPMIYTTAWHGLAHLARLEAGETVLIHSAAGGVGQAAITIAQYLGAEVYATVGSEEKQDFLMKTYGIPRDRIFSSRDTSFYDGLMKVTGGRGVDVVLNSLAGSLLQASWECIAPFGRLIELGKQDSQSSKALSMKNFSNSAAYIAMDLVQLGIHKPNILFKSFKQVMDLLTQEKIQHLIPISTYEMGNVSRAFRKLLTGSHIGKIVVKAKEGNRISVITAWKTVKFSDTGAYLIVGGLSGIGLEISRWMAKQGAKNLVLLSRNAEKPENDYIVSEFSQYGTAVSLCSCDVADKTSLEKLVNGYRAKTPIRGVIQAAVVLQDSMFVNMTYEQWQNAVRPKVEGTSNLNDLFQSRDLDFFVILSSTTAILGNSGQANYTAAGTYQDALALMRVQNGLPAVSINIGSVPSVGVAARANVGARLEKAGYQTQDIPEILRLLEISISNPYQGQMTTGIMPWNRAGDLNWRNEPRFANLCLHNEAEGDGNPTDSNKSLKSRLLESPAEEVQDMLTGALRLRLADIFGMSASDIDPEMPLATYGVDSLVASELRNWLVRNVAAGVSLFDIVQSSSVQDLAGRIKEKL